MRGRFPPSRDGTARGSGAEAVINDLVGGALAAILVLVAGLAGILFQRILPRHHVEKGTLDVMRLAAGLLSVLTSLVFGLLIATAKSASDTAGREMRSFATDIILLDRTLKSYGDEAALPRALLLQAGQQTLRDLWPDDRSVGPGVDNVVTSRLLERMRQAIVALPAPDADKAWFRTEALHTSQALLRQHWVMVEEGGSTVSMAVLSIVLFWTMLIFFNFGLNAPYNSTLLGAFALVSLAIGSAVFLVLELDRPFDGVLAVSDHALRRAVAELVEEPG